MRQKTRHERTQEEAANASNPEAPTALPTVWRWLPRGPEEWLNAVLLPGKVFFVGSLAMQLLWLNTLRGSNAQETCAIANLFIFLAFFLTSILLRVTGRAHWRAARFHWSIAFFVLGVLAGLFLMPAVAH